MKLSEHDLYSSDTIFIPAKRISDIIGLLVISLFLFLTGYPIFDTSSAITAEMVTNLDKKSNGIFTDALSYANAAIAPYSATKGQIIFVLPFLLILSGWILFIRDFLDRKSGLSINKMGISYTPVLFKSEDESTTILKLDWGEIDYFEIGQEINLKAIKFPFLKVYINPLTHKKTKAEKFISNIASKIAAIAHIDTSNMHTFYEIKRLNADLNEVKKLLDKRLSEFRKNNGEFFDTINS